MKCDNKGLWEKLQNDKSNYNLLSIDSLKLEISKFYKNKNNSVIHIPATLVLNMNDATFSRFIKTKNDYKIDCNIEQYELIQKRINKK